MVHRDVELPAETTAALDAVALLSGKWQPVVLVVLADRGPLGFNDLLDAIPGVSGKVLTETLTALDDAALVERTVRSESPLRVEYALTPAGRDLDAVFDALATWATRHLDSPTATVLVADDDRRRTERYARWLTDRYATRRAHDRETFEAHLDDAVDVVLVAETVPGIAPDELDDVVASDQQVVLAVTDHPGCDVLAVACDDVVRKPLDRGQLRDVVEDQLDRREASPAVREYRTLAAKRSLLESTDAPAALAENDAYDALCSRMSALEDRFDE